MTSLFDRVDSQAAIRDIVGYNVDNQACSGHCDFFVETLDFSPITIIYLTDSTYSDNATTKVVYMIRYCPSVFSILNFDAICSLQYYFTDGSSTSAYGSGVTCASSCTNRTFGSSASPKAIRYFNGWHRAYGFSIDYGWSTYTMSYDMATGFTLTDTDGTIYSFGTLSNVNHG